MSWSDSPPPGFLEGSAFKETLYHGTGAELAPGAQLRPDAGGEYGIYLTPRRQTAAQYGAQVYEVFVNIQRPRFVENKGEISSADLTLADVLELERAGFDSIVSAPAGVRDIGRAHEVVLFHPEQAHVFRQRGPSSGAGVMTMGARTGPIQLYKSTALVLESPKREVARRLLADHAAELEERPRLRLLLELIAEGPVEATGPDIARYGELLADGDVVIWTPPAEPGTLPTMTKVLDIPARASDAARKSFEALPVSAHFLPPELEERAREEERARGRRGGVVAGVASGLTLALVLRLVFKRRPPRAGRLAR